MYAVVQSGGKQMKVAVGETVSVELLDASPGAVVTLSVLAVNDGDTLVVGEDAAKATVTAEVLGHGKADKVMIFKLKKRKGYKRTRGHRQNMTLLKVTDIALAGAKKAAKAAKAVDAVVAEKPVAEKKAAPKAAAKPAAKKAAAPKAAAKPAAKKAAAPKAAAPKAEAAAKPAAKKPAVAKKPAAPKADAVQKKAAAPKKPAAKKTTKPAEPAE